MSAKHKEKLRGVVYEAMIRSFNRSLNALEDAGAIDKSELTKHYKGVGSSYYDIVTSRMESTLDEVQPALDEIIDTIKSEVD